MSTIVVSVDRIEGKTLILEADDGREFKVSKRVLKGASEGMIFQVPLSGDRAPFATTGYKLHERVGFKVVRVDPATREVVDMIRNARGGPASALKSGQGLIERPVAIKFGRDGTMYVVDFGVSTHKSAREKVKASSGRVLRLEPLEGTPSTRPSAVAASQP